MRILPGSVRGPRAGSRALAVRTVRALTNRVMSALFFAQRKCLGCLGCGDAGKNRKRLSAVTGFCAEVTGNGAELVALIDNELDEEAKGPVLRAPEERVAALAQTVKAVLTRSVVPGGTATA